MARWCRLLVARLWCQLILRKADILRIIMQQSTYKTLRTEATIAEVHVGTAQDVDTAVKAAKAALVHPSWKLLPGTERGILMGKLADLIEANKEVLASIEAWDNGMHSL
jgi:acyl-CoA reductase-like NAD-dependent aldehyde dehydrogenase